MNGFRLYWRFVSAGYRAQMLYPGAFLLRVGSQFAITIVEFASVWAMFERFGHVRGWRFAEVALFYAIASIAFAIGDGLSRGFDSVGPMLVKTGNFDRLLLRPRSSALQVTGQEFPLNSIGRLAQGLLVLAIAIALLKPAWSLGQMLVLMWAAFGGGALFYALKTFEGTMSFWTTEGLEVANTLTYGGEAAAQYPLDVYARWFRNLLLTIVPIGCCLYLPVALVLGHDTGVPRILEALAPATGFAFLAVALLVWGFGIRHYTSTGS